MLKKCALCLRGFIRFRTLIILLIFIATFYIYQDRFYEAFGKIIESNRNNGGMVFYLEGIWNKMKRMQQISDSRSKNSMELFENRKLVKEKSGLFSLEIPESWKVTSNEGVKGNQISKMIIENPSFSEHKEDLDIFYDNGAQLTIQIIRGEQQIAKLFDGGHGSMLIRKGSVDVSGQSVTYHIISDVNVKEGEIIDAHILHDGNTFNFRLADNPKIFAGGEFAFQEILISLKFLNK